jgi:glycosyltransferase involved in cell wall biosynthesis
VAETGRTAGAAPRAEGAGEARPVNLSVVMPVYNEARTIGEIVARVRNAPVDLAREIVIVDDASSDGTPRALEKLAAEHHEIRVFSHGTNQGKGAAIRTGIAQARGDIVIIQDADLEYDPRDYPALLEPILEDSADVVFGNRFHGGPHRVLYFWHYVANRGLTLLTNVLTGLNLTDMEVGYKVFRRETLAKLRLTSNRFGVEPEMAIKVARLRCRIYEVPIRYHGRTYEEGKKITWADGVAALYHIVRYRYFD